MKLKSIFVAAAVLLGATPAMADTSIGAKISTLGLGLQATTNAVPMLLNVRVLGSGFNYSTTVEDTSVTYDGTLKLQSIGAILDLYPFAGKFRISGGVFYNGNKINLDAQPVGGTFTFNGQTYTPADLGTVKTEITFNTLAPYVGIGYGDSVSSGSPVGFNLELGVLSQGAAKAKVTASSTIPGLAAQFATDAAAEEQQLNDSLKSYKYYPVIAVGVTFKF